MSHNFTTNAFNFTSSLKTQVDSRTGQFLVNLPIANLAGNRGLGPNLDLGLSYSPLSSSDNGFGEGISLSGITYLDFNSDSLNLSNGENYKLIPGTSRLRHQKLKNFKLERTEDSKGYSILWKEGNTEILEKISDDFYVTKKIISPLGKELNFHWRWTGRYPQLISVEDDFQEILDTSHKDYMVKIILWPETEESFITKFTMSNGYLDVISLTSGKEELKWYLQYSSLGNSKLAITEISYPNGLEESVYYSQSQGLKFPNNSPFDKLPVVTEHNIRPGVGQKETQTIYSYTSQNFLGFNSDFGDWKEDDDYIYSTLTDYTYGSTATTTSGGEEIQTTRMFNNYHLQISEEVRNKDCVTLSEVEYHAKRFTFIDSQPNQFQLPKIKKSTWKYNNSSKKRSQVEETKFDEEGNIIYSKDHSGVVTEIEWYDSEGEDGCPEEPNGFKKFMKSKIVNPIQTSESDYELPVSETVYTYIKLEDSECIVKESELLYLDDNLIKKNVTEYEQDRDNENFGRIIETSSTLFDIDSSDSYETKMYFSREEDEDTFTEEIECVNFDGIEFTTKTTKTLYRNLLVSETNSEEIQTDYYYDDLSRLTSKEVIFPDSDYDNLIHTWKYKQNKGLLIVTQEDEEGNAFRESYNSLGQLMKKESFDSIHSEEWYEIESFEYNSLNDVVSFELKDWITFGRDKYDSFTSKGSFEYDKWGNLSSTKFKNNIREIKETDFVNLTTSETREHRGSSTKKSFEAMTYFNENSNPLSQEVYDSKGNFLFDKSFKYDGEGKIFEENDEEGNVTQYTYDIWGRLEEQILPDGTIVTREYAPYLSGSHVTSISVTGEDHKGDVQTWVLGTREFDSLGRVTESTVGGRTTYYEYEELSKVPAKIINPSGEEIEQTLIPELGDKIAEIRADGIRQTFEYDTTTGLLIQSEEEGGGELSYKWSEKGDLLRESFYIPGQSTKRAYYEHTLNGQILSEEDFTGKEKDYIRNKYGLITEIRDDEVIVELEYDDLNRIITETTTNRNNDESITTDFTYNDINQEIKRVITHSKGPKTTISQEFNKKGQIVERERKDKNGSHSLLEEFEYDSRSRLIDYRCSGETLPKDAYGNSFCRQEYTYDSLNNITSLVTYLSEEYENEINITTFHFDNDSDPTQLTSLENSHEDYPSEIELEYDDNGYLIRDEEGRKLTYDALGRLISIESEDENTLGEYSYDPCNRIIGIEDEEEDKVYSFYYQNDEVTSQIIDSSDGEEISRLIKINSKTLAMSLKDRLTLTCSNQANTLVFSVEEEEEEDSYTFSPYGEGEAPKLIPAFNGELQDPISRNYNLGNGNRSYSPKLMRFTSPDIMSPFNGGGINPYSYCLGDPVNNVDPSGNISIKSWLGIAVSILGLIAVPFTAGASTAAFVASVGQVVAKGVAIAAILVSELTDNNKVSSILGWVSIGLGLCLSGYGASKKILPSVKKSYLSVGENITNFGALSVEVSFSEDTSQSRRSSSVLDSSRTGKNEIRTLSTNNSPRGLETEAVFNFIKNKKDLSDTKCTRTIVCHSGRGGENSFSQKMANISGKEIKSYIETMTIDEKYSSENTSYSEEQSKVRMYDKNKSFYLYKQNSSNSLPGEEKEKLNYKNFRYNPISFKPSPLRE